MTAGPSGHDTQKKGQRIDKWLWHARFARTRTAAQQLAVSGHVRINRQRVSTASRSVKPDDVLTIAIGRTVRVVTVLAIADRRGSAKAAETLYEDRVPKVTIAAQVSAGSDRNPAIRSDGKPDKRGRQRILAMKRKQF